MSDKFAAWRAARDAKVRVLIDEKYPAWLLNETIDEENQTIQFDLVHYWPPYGWQRRHYTYEVEVDVLHFRGTHRLNAEERMKLKNEDLFYTPSPQSV